MLFLLGMTKRGPEGGDYWGFWVRERQQHAGKEGLYGTMKKGPTER
jgi:hypothetical protein